MDDLPPRVNLLIKRALAALEEFHRAIKEHSELIHAANELNRDENPAGKITRVISFDDKTVRDSKAEGQRQHSTQNSIRWATWCAVGAAVVYGGIAALQWCEMRKATLAATSSAQTARDTLIASNRPWLTASVTLDEPPHSHSPGPSFTLNKDGSASLNAFIGLKNIGRSPANSIYVDARMFPPPFTNEGMVDPIKKQREWCAQVRLQTHDELLSPSLFPEEETTMNYTVGMTKADIEASLASLKLPGQKFITPIVFGCVNYGDAISHETHQTQFMFELEPITVREGTILGSKLKIFKYPFGGTIGY